MAATRVSFANQPDRGDLIAYPATRVVRRDGAYTWHRADLSEAHALRAIATGRMEITTPLGVHLQFRYERHVGHLSGDLTWVGRLQGGQRSDEVVLTFGDRAVFGSLAQPGLPPLRLTMAGGVSWLVETDPRQIAGIRNEATDPSKPDYLVPPATAAAQASADQPVTAAGATATAATAGASNTVDVLLGYTSGFSSANNGAPLTRLNYMVEITNQAYINSGSDARVRLVHAMQVDYPDNTDNGATLEDMTGFKAPSTRTTPGAAFTALRAARDQYGADLVSLVRKFNTPENGGCGIAWLIGGGQSGIDASDELFGYSVVSDGRDAGTDGKTYFCREETLAHELGHNMGSQHDVTAAKGADGVLDAKDYGVFSYSFGYKTGIDAGNVYTVMAYGDTGQTPYRIFSNPRTTFCGGYACGTSQADNARSLGQTVPLIASFRASVVQAAAAAAAVPSDVNGDLRSDVIWHNVTSGELYFWAINDSTVVGGQGAAYLPVGYAAIGTGDFDGDGRADVLSANGADVRVSLAQGTGGFGAATVVSSRPPAGWSFAGAGDVNGDRRADIIWHNVTSGELYYWVLNGFTIVGGQGGAYLPVGHSAIAISDLNGDGLADVVAANSLDVRVSFAKGTGVFAAAVVIASRPPAGWTLIGAGDVNGDGQSDLVWHNVNSGELYFWAMSGSTVFGGQGGAYLAAGHAALGIGDFNGDRRADVVSASGADIRVSFSQGAGFGAPAVVASRPPAGWSYVSPLRRNAAVPNSDANGDNKSDVIWHNVNSGELYYWAMSGSTIVGGQGAAYLPLGYTALGFGDFNGDGRVDVVSANSADMRISLAQGSAGFGSPIVVSSRPPAGWTFAGAGDVNGDGRSDLIWHNVNSGELYHWMMNGAAIVGGQGAAYLPLGHSMIGIGDVNDDGRADVVSANSADVRVSLAQGAGGFGPARVISSRPPAGWNFAGAGDVNGDGKADLIWHNVNSGELYYWAMESAAIVGGQGAAYLPGGYSAIGIGDYNGDGRADILSANSVEVRISLAQGAGGFGPAALVSSRPPSGWSLVATRAVKQS